MSAPEKVERLSIVIPDKLIDEYLKEFCAFLNKQRNTYLLGAICLLRQMENCIYSQMKLSLQSAKRSTLFDELTEQLQNIYLQLNPLLHYQGYRGIDPLAQETADYESAKLGGAEGEPKPGTVFINCLISIRHILSSLDLSGQQPLQNLGKFDEALSDKNPNLAVIREFDLRKEPKAARESFVLELYSILFDLHKRIDRKKYISRIGMLSAAVLSPGIGCAGDVIDRTYMRLCNQWHLSGGCKR